MPLKNVSRGELGELLQNNFDKITAHCATDQHLDCVEESISDIILGQLGEDGEERDTQLVDGDIHGLMDDSL
jgi:hypothetical protein